MSVTETRSVASIIGGQAREGGTQRGVAQPGQPRRAGLRGVADGRRRVRRRLPRRTRGAARLGRHAGAGARQDDRARSGGWWRTTRRRSRALLTREIGKPYPESLGEVQEVIDTCDFFVSEGRRLYGQTVPSELPDKQLFTFRNPVGVAAIITAGNFPVAVPSWYLVPALAVRQRGRLEAGRVRAGAGPGADRAVPGRRAARRRAQPGPVRRARPRSRAWSGRCRSALVDKVGFTGSSEVGSRIGELCGRHVQSPCLELGGKNPLVVMPDADLDLAAEGVAVQRLRDRGPALHLARHGDRARVGPRRVHAPLHRAWSRRPRSATRSPRCSTGR